MRLEKAQKKKVLAKDGCLERERGREREREDGEEGEGVEGGFEEMR